MKKLLLIVLALCLLVSCASIGPNSEGSKFMAGVEDTGSDSGLWEKYYYLDEFLSPTDKAYITVPIVGAFSDSLAAGSLLTGYLVVEEDLVKIELYEYDIYPAAAETGSVYVKMKAGDEVVDVGSAVQKDYSFVLYDAKAVFDLFTRYDEVQFYVETASKYYFSVSTAGFIHAYKTAFVSK